MTSHDSPSGSPPPLLSPLAAARQGDFSPRVVGKCENRQMGPSIWDWLRLSRSGPFGEAGRDEERARIYRAAMQQFEDLMRAASATGPSGAPLPLFYSLSQAGRAIVVARGGPDHRRHGITIEDPEEDLLRTIVRPTKHDELGQFQAVALAVESPALHGPVELGALLASLPELSDKLLLATNDWPRALGVWPDEERGYYPRHPEWLPIRIVFDDDVETNDDVARVLARYPSARGKTGSPPEAGWLPEPYRTPTPGGMGVRVMWRDDGAGIDGAFPEYRHRGSRWLRPAVIGEEEPPNPLMTWWALLFGLSMLARYHPVPWTEALDPDTSAIAVPLERTMTEGLDALPHLVFEALLGEAVVVPARWL